MLEQAPGVFWFGTGGQGLKKYDQKTRKLTTYLHDPTNPFSLCSDFIEKLLQDQAGMLWAATWDGLSRFDPKTERFTTYKPEDDHRGLNYHAIANTRAGVLWLGSNLGLYRFDPMTGSFSAFRHDPNDSDSLSDNRVNSIYQARDGTLWIGTQNGLDSFDPQSSRFTHFTERNGMAGNAVSCILEDHSGHLWMSTNRGISKFSPAQAQFKNYTVADGLPGADMTGWGACSQTGSGEMFFGGFAGATALYPISLSIATILRLLFLPISGFLARL